MKLRRANATKSWVIFKEHEIKLWNYGVSKIFNFQQSLSNIKGVKGDG
jgi:hypothetical protein